MWRRSRSVQPVMIMAGDDVKEQVVGVTSKEDLAELIEKHLKGNESNE